MDESGVFSEWEMIIFSFSSFSFFSSSSCLALNLLSSSLINQLLLPLPSLLFLLSCLYVLVKKMKLKSILAVSSDKMKGENYYYG